jgi:D-aminoacyl-tRNA deacylase
VRAVVQRVTSASVTVEDEVVGRIGGGAAVLLGIAPSDGPDEARWLADRVANLRIFRDDEGKMNRPLKEAGGAVLLVSQFTLYGDARRGRRPSFVSAAQGPEAERVYRLTLDAVRDQGLSCEAGIFGAMMQVALVNDGPVTILLDSDKLF